MVKTVQTDAAVVTVNVIDTVRVIAPLTPCTLRLYVPAAAEAEVESVSTDVVAGTGEDGLKEAVIPAGNPSKA
jgi:hypothetical protein